MKVLCYVNGDKTRGQEYVDEWPADAARLYVEEWRDDILDTTNIVVEPADAGARLCDGWTLRPDGARVRLFVVTPIVRWEPEEVQRFDQEAP